MRFFIAGLVLLLVLPLNGFGQNEKSVPPAPVADACALFEPVTNARTDSSDSGNAIQTRLLAIYNAQARLVRSLKATAIVRAIRGQTFGPQAGKSIQIINYISFNQPARIRVTGAAPPFGKTVFDLTSDGRDVQLLAPDHNVMKFYVGRVDSLPGGSDPNELLDALRWQEGTLRKAVDKNKSPDAQSDTIDLDLPPRSGKSIEGRLQFDSRSGAVTSLQLHTVDGKLISELRYADWRRVSGAGGGSPQACFPRQVHLILPVEDVELEIRFQELTLNPRIPGSSFRLNRPAGTPVVHLDSAMKKKH